MYSLGVFLLWGRGVTDLCPYVQGTEIGLLSPLTGHGSLCLHTEIHVLVPVTADCECLVDIAAARHAHW